MEITAVIRCILTPAELFGSQEYYNKSLTVILGFTSLMY